MYPPNSIKENRKSFKKIIIGNKLDIDNQNVMYENYYFEMKFPFH